MIKTYINQPYKFPAPAKLNLFLHVVGQRNDGYHELETLFQFLDYSDTIEITVTTNSDIILLTPLDGVDNEDNLIVKAAKLLQEKVFQQKHKHHEKPLLGAKISIEKILPMGGGLGGGSSNAATILVALNALWQCEFSAEQLAGFGLSLGADVPIFVQGFAAFAQGIGEKLTPVQPEECWYLVSKPDCSISTASVFKSTDLPRATAKLIHKDFNNPYRDDLFKDCRLNNGKYHNDCQTMVIKHYDKVANLLAWLIEYAPSRMTGTGACVFSCFASKQAAYDLQVRLPKGINSFIAKGLNKSLLLPVIEDLVK
ncbi:MAG: 4-diphosphocytidyl-2-C-methyl-D-erythritol kinase [Colwellia sp.]|jgi:4-diphosphocytidyl-2-C-methyl-D-erythritol kinase|tara:strand:- start:1396 stop:2331 length:936 start_codon:yes stop_codon:yes gene_type:complete